MIQNTLNSYCCALVAALFCSRTSILSFRKSVCELGGLRAPKFDIIFSVFFTSVCTSLLISVVGQSSAWGLSADRAGVQTVFWANGYHKIHFLYKLGFSEPLSFRKLLSRHYGGIFTHYHSLSFTYSTSHIEQSTSGEGDMDISVGTSETGANFYKGHPRESILILQSVEKFWPVA